MTIGLLSAAILLLAPCHLRLDNLASASRHERVDEEVSVKRKSPNEIYGTSTVLRNVRNVLLIVRRLY